MNCPTIMVHVGKQYKALVDLGAVISLVRYSTDQTIDKKFKITIQLTSIQVTTADGSPMTALGMTTLQLRIADFRFSHTFIIYNRLLEVELLFGIDVQKKYSLYYTWGREKKKQKDGKFLTYTRNCEQKAHIAVFKSTLKIPPWHNGIVPMKIKRHVIKGHTAYFISNQDSKKGKDPNIRIIDEFHNIKGKTFVNILISNYTNKHITFNKGEYIGCLEPPIEEIHCTLANTDSLTNHSITMERMMAKKVEPDTLNYSTTS